MKYRESTARRQTSPAVHRAYQSSTVTSGAAAGGHRAQERKLPGMGDIPVDQSQSQTIVVC